MADLIVSPLAVPTTDFTPHSRAAEILQKFDYWFSDENIRKDGLIYNLLRKHGKNSPVNVGGLHKRLTAIFNGKPTNKQIMAALRDSTVLDVFDKERVIRKLPFVQDDEPGDGIWNPETDTRKFRPPPPPHPGVAAGTFKTSLPTGFEPGFADPPITPAEYEENRMRYDAELHDAPTRINYAIARYVVKRRFTQEFQQHFIYFLRYGGIKQTNPIGQGNAGEGLEDAGLSNEDKADLLFRYDVDEDDKLDETKWCIDFVGVAKSYLSTQFALDFGDYTDNLVENQCGVMHNLYNFFLHHDVLPELEQEIVTAQAVTVQGREELKKIRKLNRALPTPFTTACSILYGGEWKAVLGEAPEWTDRAVTEDQGHIMDQNAAETIVSTALMTMAEPELESIFFPQGALTLDLDKLQFSEKRNVTLEVTGIERATDGTKDFYGGFLEGKDLNAKPVGMLHCKYWDMPVTEDWDVPKRMRSKADKKATYTSWLEDDVLAVCFLGMKMKASIYRLSAYAAPDKNATPGETASLNQNDTPDNNATPGETDTPAQTNGDQANATPPKLIHGPWILDGVSRIYCSFYTYMLNEIVTPKTSKNQSVIGDSRPVVFNDLDALRCCQHPGVTEEVKQKADETAKQHTRDVFARAARIEKERREREEAEAAVGAADEQGESVGIHREGEEGDVGIGEMTSAQALVEADRILQVDHEAVAQLNGAGPPKAEERGGNVQREVMTDAQVAALAEEMALARIQAERKGDQKA